MSDAKQPGRQVDQSAANEDSDLAFDLDRQARQKSGPLSGKMALVTGSTRGLGRTIAETLAWEGVSIVVSGRDEGAVQDTVDVVRQFGVQSFGIPADLSNPGEAHRLAEEALARVQQLDILINNAGMSIRGHFWEVSDADWDYQVNVNYRSSFILAQHAARHMIARGIRGRIINTGTIGARAAHKDAAVYDSAKGAVEVMTRNMACELGPFGITVNCVIPGNIAERPGVLTNAEQRARRKQEGDKIPVGRVGRGEDIAAGVRFFCLPDSEFTTGQALLIDGGDLSQRNR